MRRIAGEWRTRPKYMSLTRSQDSQPGSAVAGTETPKLTVASPPGATSTPCVHGPVVCQVPMGEMSWTSPRSCEPRLLVTLTVSSPLSPAVSRSSGVTSSMAASPASAWTSDCMRKNSSSGSRLASGAPASPTVTSAVSRLPPVP